MSIKQKQTLKKRLDRLNLLWDVFHDELLEISPPVDCEAVYDGPDENGECLVLGFGKINGKWEIFTGARSYCPDGEWCLTEVKPINECRAGMRVHLVKFAPLLRNEVEAGFAKFIDETDKSIAEFESQLDLTGFKSEKSA